MCILCSVFKWGYVFNAYKVTYHYFDIMLKYLNVEVRMVDNANCNYIFMPLRSI